MSEPYVPDEDAVRFNYADCAHRYNRNIPIKECEAEFDRFLAKVRRDAAREALDGLARRFEAQGDGADMADQWAWEWRAQSEVEEYCNTYYPEEEAP